jgi:FkbM family methyltransferase
MSLSDEHTELLRRDPLCIVDVGARGGMQQHWAGLRQHALFIGFEPDQAECARLAANAPPNERYIPRALHSHETSATLHFLGRAASSSLYPPNFPLFEEIYGDAEEFRVVRTEPLECTSFDALLRDGSCVPPSFMKLDTQGSELDILKGARERGLDSVIGIEIEVEFVPLYQNQPLFADVDVFLRAAGFELVDFIDLFTRSTLRFGVEGVRGYSNAMAFVRAWLGRILPPRGSLSGVSSLVYANALYFRRVDSYLDYAKHRSPSARTAIVKAVVLATELRAYPWALELLDRAARDRLITETDRASLARHIQSNARSLKPIASQVQRLIGKFAHRLKHPRRDA